MNRMKSCMLFRPSSAFAFIAVISALTGVSAFAKAVPDNLGNGLDKIVENNLIQKGVVIAPPAVLRSTATIAAHNAAVAKSTGGNNAPVTYRY
jgi:hypothetical protein